jgi:RecA/RadA recombinase
MDTDKVKKVLLSKDESQDSSLPGDFLSTGITLLDLATYGRVGYGYRKGRVYRMVGRSSTGKTWLARTALAEAANNPAFGDHDLIYDDVERGAQMDTERFFGRKLAKRLLPPGRTTKGSPVYSRGILDFYKRISRRLDRGKPIIWVEDSLDALEALAETKMGDGKAKVHSQELRKLLNPLDETGSILILTSQAKTDLRSLFGQDTTSGGFSPEYYATLTLWLSKVGSVKTKYNSVTYNQGVKVQARVKKNRLSGQDASVHFCFYPSFGIDNTGACVDFLIKANHWKKKDGKFHAQEFMLTESRKRLVEMIDSDRELCASLYEVVAEVWGKIQEACTVSRTIKYE